jgi:flagellar P-ring protein precursor FlgI
VGCFSTSGQAASVQKNHPTVGRISNGVSIEREIGYEFVKTESIVISLKTPDFTNARRIEERINNILKVHRLLRTVVPLMWRFRMN